MIVVVLGDWRSQALRGVLAVLFGVAALTWPRLTLTALVVLFGAFALVEGIFTLSGVITGGLRAGERRWPFVLHGLAGIAVGLVTFFWPNITTLALLYLIAAWALVTGAFEIADTITLREYIEPVWLFLLNGAIRIAFGIILFAAPGTGALAITWLIGWFALLTGVLHLVLAWRLRQLEEAVDRVRRPAQAQPA
jgi:uncharacterized membrane protein HdeD (DUF308 family)